MSKLRAQPRQPNQRRLQALSRQQRGALRKASSVPPHDDRLKAMRSGRPTPSCRFDGRPMECHSACLGQSAPLLHHNKRDCDFWRRALCVIGLLHHSSLLPRAAEAPIIQKFRCHNSSFTNKKTLPFYRQCGFSRSASISLWG